MPGVESPALGNEHEGYADPLDNRRCCHRLDPLTVGRLCAPYHGILRAIIKTFVTRSASPTLIETLAPPRTYRLLVPSHSERREETMVVHRSGNGGRERFVQR